MVIHNADGSIGLVPFGGDLDTVLRYMQRRGSSVDLNYGEDTGMWECSWITGGTRFTAVGKSATSAARDCLRQVSARLGEM